MSEWAGSAICLTFKRQLFEALHDFRLDTFRLALYGSTAALGAGTASYTEDGEIPPTEGYLTGGKPITMDVPLLVGETALVPFDSVVWSPASFTARGALCYNASKAGLPAVFVLDFGVERQANGNNFVVQFPGADPGAAIVRIA